MSDIPSQILATIAWPLALAIAWLAGEAGYRWLSLPRISSYGLAGFLLASSQGGFLANPTGEPVALLANFALSLILFELGYRINLRWLRANPWLGVTSFMEAGTTFAAVFIVARTFSLEMLPSLLLAALAMPTSPAAVLCVVNEMRSSGQVTERTLHLTAFNCVLAVIVFKAIVGYGLVMDQGDLFQAAWSSVVVVLVSTGIGAMFGVTVASLLRATSSLTRNATVAFAIAILLLTVFSHALKFSPLLAALAFGLVARHRRVVLSQAQSNFGTLGNLLTVLLFVFVAATLDWHQVIDGMVLALAIVAVRLLSKITSTTLFARTSGVTWRKGVLTGMALTPLSVFAILLLEQTRHLGIGLVDELAGMAAMVLLLEMFGPIATQWALRRAGESQQQLER